VRLDPGFADAYGNLGAALGTMGRSDEAIRWHREALRLRADADAHCNLGVALVEAGRVDEAEAAFREAVALEPSNANALMRLGATLAERGRYEEAIKAFKEALAIDPANTWLRSSLKAHAGRAVTLRYPEIRPAYEAALKATP
jgi:tetratricopeptide (TPR) repeat protein